MCRPHLTCTFVSVDDHLDCTHLLEIVNNAAVNTGVQKSFWDPSFNSFSYIPRSEIAGSYDNSIFNSLRNCHTVFFFFYGGHFTCPPVTHRGSLFSTSSRPFAIFWFFVCSCFWIVSILADMRYCLMVVSICIFLMICHLEYLFMCLLGIYISSLDNCLFPVESVQLWLSSNLMGLKKLMKAVWRDLKFSGVLEDLICMVWRHNYVL